MSAISLTQRRAARVAGALYLVTMASAVYSEVIVRGALVVAGDATATARNIARAEVFYRSALANDLVTVVGVAGLVWALHAVLAPVSPALARLGLILRTIECAVATAALVPAIVALRFLSTVPYLQAFDEAQRAVLVRVCLGAQATGMQVAFVFLGLGSAAFSLLWYRSRYVPRALAGLGVVASLLLSAIGALFLVVPGVAGHLGIVAMLPMGVYEVGLGAWLLMRGATPPIKPRPVGTGA